MRALFFLVISTLCHAVIWTWLQRAFPKLRAHKKVMLAVFGTIVVLVPLGRIVLYRIDGGLARIVTAFAMAELLAALIALVPMSVLLIVSSAWKYRTATSKPADALEAPVTPAPRDATPAVAPVAPKPSEALGRRETFERLAGAAVLAGSSGAIGWGAVRGRLDFQIEEVIVKIPGLPRVLEGYTIAQISDIHVGLFVQERELAQGLAFVARTKPDLVVATGDLVDFDARYIPLMARSLGDLRARDGVAAILGNHDYYTDGFDVREALVRAGVRALVNEHHVFRPNDGGGIVLGGVDDYSGARYGGEGPNLQKTFAGAPDAPRILLAHQPHFFADAQGKVALQLSGHVHGGQVNPIVHPVRWVLRYVAGRYEAGGSTMWVNRGFGTAGPPARVGAPPEISKIVLVSA